MRLKNDTVGVFECPSLLGKYTKVCWITYMVASYLLLMTFSTNGIQVLQHSKRLLKNKSHFVTWEYLDPTLYFSVELYFTYIPLFLYVHTYKYTQTINRWNETQFLPGSGHIDTAIWVHYMEKKLDGNYTRMLRAILNKSWRQHPKRHQLYGHLPPITKTIQVTRTRHAGHCWRSRDELIRDVLLWTPTHGRAKAGRPVRTYIQQLCEDAGCCRTIGRSGERG